MKIELEFLDNTKTRLNDQEMEYDGAIPVPMPGDYVSFGGEVWQVEKRDFIYVSGETESLDLKVSIWVKKPEST